MQVSVFANFEVGRLIKKKNMEYKNTCRPCYVSEEAYNCTVREIWAVSFVKDDGCVGAIPTYRVYRLYDM